MPIHFLSRIMFLPEDVKKISMAISDVASGVLLQSLVLLEFSQCLDQDYSINAIKSFSYHVRTNKKSKLSPIHGQLDRESKPLDFSIVLLACCEESGGTLELKVDAEGTSESPRSFVGSTDGASKRLEFGTPDGAADDCPSSPGENNDGLGLLDGDADGFRSDGDALSVGPGDGTSAGLPVALPENVGAEVRF
jgi:hypothetical protein